MIKVRNKAVGAAIAIAVAILAAPAGATSTTGSDILKKQNTDGDDTFEMPEVMLGAAKVFMSINPDGDATLEPDETKARLEASAFPKQDFPNNQEAAGEKTIDLYQWLSIARERYAAADANKDGKIEASELDSPAGKALAVLFVE